MRVVQWLLPDIMEGPRERVVATALARPFRDPYFLEKEGTLKELEGFCIPPLLNEPIFMASSEDFPALYKTLGRASTLLFYSPAS